MSTEWVKTRVYIVENHEVRKVPLVLLTRCRAWDRNDAILPGAGARTGVEN